MSDSMKTGGFGKNPVIDKLNRLNLADSQGNVAAELERKVFQTGQPQIDNILSRRKKLIEEFHIDFRRKGKKEDGNILHQPERGMPAGQHFIRISGDEYPQPAVRTARRFSADGGRKTAHVLSADGTAGYRSGGQQRRADYGTIHRTEDQSGRGLERGAGLAGADGRNISQIQHISGISLQGRTASGRLVPDGNGGPTGRAY